MKTRRDTMFKFKIKAIVNRFKFSTKNCYLIILMLKKIDKYILRWYIDNWIYACLFIYLLQSNNNYILYIYLISSYIINYKFGNLIQLNLNTIFNWIFIEKNLSTKKYHLKIYSINLIQIIEKGISNHLFKTIFNKIMIY